MIYGPLSAPEHSAQQRNQKQNEEEEEKYFGDSGGADGNTAKTEYRRDNRDDEENCGPVKHVAPRWDNESLHKGNFGRARRLA